MTKVESTSGLFTTSELNKIVDMESTLSFQEGAVLLEGKESIAHWKRKTDIAWVHYNPGTAFIFERMTKLWALKPISMLQSFQYSLYYDGGHYKWHRDVGAFNDNIVNNRVITGVLQLSNPEDYKGGALSIADEETDEIVKVEKEFGMITTFPAGWRHKVSPVTSGVRRTLVMWGLK